MVTRHQRDRSLRISCERSSAKIGGMLDKGFRQNQNPGPRPKRFNRVGIRGENLV